MITLSEDLKLFIIPAAEDDAPDAAGIAGFPSLEPTSAPFAITVKSSMIRIFLERFN